MTLSANGTKLGRPRREGVLDKLIKRMTRDGYVYQLAKLLEVSNRAVYAWDRGEIPNTFYKFKINLLCVQCKLKPIYKFNGEFEKCLLPVLEMDNQQVSKKKEVRRGKKGNQRQRIHAV